MRIEWVNHASFVAEHGGVRLISDPWLDGYAFHNGWAHLTPTRFGYEDFARITHIWFSHEHPDHFSPSNVRSIPEEARARITVLYQCTKDRKVIDFCRKLGFERVVELPPGEWYPLATGFDVLCEPYTAGDSWIALRTPERVLLNLNDCVVKSAGQCHDIQRVIGNRPVDVLLTQFSYANWVGNRDDLESRRREAAEKIARVRTQIETFAPRFVIPFASFVWFCHEENHYLNDAINHIGPVHEFIDSMPDTSSIVLYPEDEWTVDEPHDSGPALERYAADYGRVLGSPELVRPDPVDTETLRKLATEFVERFRERNGGLFLQVARLRNTFAPTLIHVTDLERVFRFSLDDALEDSDASPESCDISLGSEAFAYCLRVDWGGDTLQVNGRFQAPPGGDLARFRLYFDIASLNNHGITYSSYMRRRLLERITGR